MRPACESGSLPPLPPPVARISAWRRSTSRTFWRRAARTSRRRGGRTAAPRRGSAPSSSCVTATPSLSNESRSDSQSTPLDTRALALSVSLRTFTSTRSSGTKRSQSSGSWPMPSVQNWMASSPRATKPLPSSSGTRPRSRSWLAACLLGGDVAPDAARSRRGSRELGAVACLRRLDDDRRASCRRRGRPSPTSS